MFLCFKLLENPRAAEFDSTKNLCDKFTDYIISTVCGSMYKFYINYYNYIVLKYN